MSAPLELGAMVRVALPSRLGGDPDLDVEVRALIVSRPRELTATVTHPGGGRERIRWRLVEVLVEGDGEPCEVAVERIVEEHAEGEAAEVDRASALASTASTAGPTAGGAHVGGGGGQPPRSNSGGAGRPAGLKRKPGRHRPPKTSGDMIDEKTHEKAGSHRRVFR